MIVEDPGSPYLTRPLRTLRDACFDIAASHGLAAPECEDCELERTCVEQLRHLRRTQKKRLRSGGGSAVPRPLTTA